MQLINTEIDIKFETDYSLQFLWAELAHIDVLIQRALRNSHLARQNSSDVYLGIHITEEKVDHLLESPLWSNWWLTKPFPNIGTVSHARGHFARVCALYRLLRYVI